MATSKPKSSAGATKSTSRPKSTSNVHVSSGKSKGKPAAKPKPKRSVKKQDEKSKAIKSEVICILSISASLLMALALFTENSGFFGGAVKSVLLGLFGAGAYILPLFIAGFSLTTLLGKAKRPPNQKLIMSVLLFVVFVAFLTVLNNKGTAPLKEYKSLFLYAAASYKSSSLSSGGALGAICGGAALNVLGRLGSYILLVTAVVVLLILITGRSLFEFIARCFAYADKILEERRSLKDEYYDDEYDDEDDYLEEFVEEFVEEPKIKVKAQLKEKPKKSFDYQYEVIPKLPLLPSDGRKRVFDHIIMPEDINATERQKLSLANEEIKISRLGDRVRTAKKTSDSDIPQGAMLETTIIEFKKPPEHIPEIKSEQPFTENDNGQDNLPDERENEAAETHWDGEISVKGIGIEGYTPTTVIAEGAEPEELTNVKTQAENSSLNIASEPGSIDDQISKAPESQEYIYPPIELLKENPYVPSLSSKANILENSRKLEETLKSFGVEAKVVEVCKGPTVTRYELSPGVGVKVSKISGLADDLALNLAAVGIRIEAPVPGKSVVGIEIPNKDLQAVFLREVIGDEAFWSHPSKLSFAIGKDIAGNAVIADVAKMPHLLIAGATGAGKSVCINTLIASIIYKANPNEVKLLMIDPKVVELSVYNGIPHLLIPVVTEPKKASGALSWAVREMDLRYNLFAETMTRDLKGYNDILSERGEAALPQIVVIIDELADLMMTCGKEVEESICRLAQKARAAGIHLIIATQRPSVDVITGLIKANVPSRLAFAVSSGTDSRTILDMYGAEKLLGKGDMLFSPVGLSKPQRIQGSFISDKEVENLVNFIKRDGQEEYDLEMIEKITATADDDGEAIEGGDDQFTYEAIDFIVAKEKASVSMLQRRFRIGYNRAARLMEELENMGIVGPEDGSKPRKVLMTNYQWQEYRRKDKNI